MKAFTSPQSSPLPNPSDPVPAPPPQPGPPLVQPEPTDPQPAPTPSAPPPPVAEQAVTQPLADIWDQGDLNPIQPLEDEWKLSQQEGSNTASSTWPLCPVT